jgi:hypothetical protein
VDGISQRLCERNSTQLEAVATSDGYGIAHDDYDYSRLPVFLLPRIRSFVKKIACQPDLCSSRDLTDNLAGFRFAFDERVHIALLAIEGHLVSGYADGGDAPDKQLQLVPGAERDAAAFLEQHGATRARFDKVATLVEGFESPSGLELLSTVHWVMKHEAARTLENVIERTYAWNPRKRQFSPRQIGIGVNVLSRQGWVEPLNPRSN